MKLISKIFSVITLLLSGVTMAKGQHSHANLILHSSPLENSLGLLQQLKPVIFEYQPEVARKMRIESGPHMGFLPWETKTVFPALVSKTDKLVPSGKNSNQVLTIETVDNNQLIPVLVQTLQQQEEKINALEKQLNNLKKNMSN
jgi:hypothetical protein